MSVRRRIEALEYQMSRAAGEWFDLEIWKAEHAAGVSLDEQERRRLAEYPQHAEQIRAFFSRIRARMAALEHGMSMRGDDQ